MSNKPRERDDAPRAEISVPGDDVSEDVLLELLSHHRRRVVLALLLTHDRPLTLADLRNEVAEAAHGREITEISDSQAKRVEISLYHVHLPKLDEEGIVYFDATRNIVEPTAKLGRLEPFLDQL